ncbi:MAG: helix-turn-helix transcriptional regulator [Clostridia bacterium]|nr:helix-turn-helix transcriptional regulator [Clostridia bacterium]
MTLEAVCLHAGLSRAYLQKSFQSAMGVSVMKYYRYLRIARAKYYIRQRAWTMTEIAERLKFNTVHQFSACFRKVEGVSPREYAASVRSWIDGDLEGTTVVEKGDAGETCGHEG